MKHLLIPQQVPEYIRSEFPAFVEFIKAYYEWLSTEESLGSYGDLFDLDKTIDDFVQYFRSQLDVYGITTGTDNKFYLRHIKELYTAKGAAQGFEFFFKILYNKPASVIQPWDYVFKPSNGKWRQDTSILILVTAGSAVNFIGNPIIITDSAGTNYRTYVTNVNFRRNGLVELFISRITPQNRLVTVRTTDSINQGEVQSTLSKAIIESPGYGFTVGQVFPVRAAGGTGSLIKIKSVDSNGGITAIEIIAFGTGYTTDINILITPTQTVDVTQLGSFIQLGGVTYRTSDRINPNNELGNIVQHDYTILDPYDNPADPNDGDYFIDLTYVGKIVGEFASQDQTEYIGPNYASIRFNVSQLCIYPGYYEDSDNIIGDLVYVQDSFYYQAFSYVTVIEETIDQYADQLRKALHPTGTKHFGQYDITNDFAITLDVSPALNFITAGTLVDAMTIIEQFIAAVSYVRSHNDTYTASDTGGVTIAVQYNRTMTPDTVSTAVGETVEKTITKAPSHTVTASDTGGVTVYGFYNRTFDPETVTASHGTPAFVITLPAVQDTVTATETFTRGAASFVRSFTTDQVTASHGVPAFGYEVGNLTDTVTIIEDLQIVPGIIVADTITSSQTSFVLQPNKYIQDTVSAVDTGYVYLESYVLQSPTTYWELGYLEGEYTFT